MMTEGRVDHESFEVPSDQSAQQHQTHLDSIFMLLEENISSFVKNELKKIQKVLSPDYPECLKSQREDEDEEQRRNREAFLKITLDFLRRMKQDELADRLQSNSCELTVDTNTMHRELKLSDNNRMVTRVEEEEQQPYPDHPERFDSWHLLLCRDVLTGRCYWEVEVRGEVGVAVSYSEIRRKGDFNDCVFGYNDQSWILECSDRGYTVRHNNRGTTISSSSVSGRVAVYVDCPVGSLSFYRVSSDSLIHLHTFNTTFTQPLYPGFAFWSGPGDSVSL
ncbi:hypothetical protein EPR50_G00235320 [Perca flavescens]|uniref:B30.2/SPRY domain-containing protein n=1 Tax=Perca flavescens TaxID=8167 RepID=A0A484BY15_PERFV|nr:hypothetical protein EPR50_G00235320 [Perca flavescens]